MIYNIKINKEVYKIKYKIKYLHDIIFLIYLDYDIFTYIGHLNSKITYFINEILFIDDNIKNCIYYIIRPLKNYNFTSLYIQTAAYVDLPPLFIKSYMLENIKNILYFGAFNKNYLLKININNKEIYILDYFVKYIKKYININNIKKKNLFFIGISVGGNACIYLSTFFKKSKCFPFSPILANISEYKNIFFDFKVDVIYNSINIINLLKNKKYNYIYITISKDNSQDVIVNELLGIHMDPFFIGSLMNNKNNIYISITNYQTHGCLIYIKMFRFLIFLNNNIDLLTNNKFDKHNFFTILNNFYHNLKSS